MIADLTACVQHWIFLIDGTEDAIILFIRMGVNPKTFIHTVETIPGTFVINF